MEWHGWLTMLTVWLSIATLIALLSVGDAPVPVDAPARNNGDKEQGDVVRVEDISPQGDLEDPRDPYVSINPYELLSRMEENNFEDMAEIATIMKAFKMSHCTIKHRYKRRGWDEHAETLVTTKQFNQRYWMSKDEFDILLAALEPAITVNFHQSR